MSPDPSHQATATVALRRHDGLHSPQDVRDQLAVEEPLELRVEGKAIAVLMRTPGHDEELVAGFLLTEGLIASRADVFEINCCPSVSGAAPGNAIDVLLTRPDPAKIEALTRHVFSASSCGICGKSTIASIHQHFPPLRDDGPRFSARLLQQVPALVLARQEIFRLTGGLHGAALIAADGTVTVVREDVGRHNAVDKILGRALLDENLPLATNALFVSGRISFEIVQKALAGRIALIAGVSAPTSLAVTFAQANGQTLIGFLREERMNVYAGTVD